MRKVDLTGRIFGRLTVLRENGKTRFNKSRWDCICECGNVTNCSYPNLVGGDTTSCGCYNKERISEIKTKHGQSGKVTRTPEYQAWASMIQRCYNTESTRYKNWGGRGVSVCERWRHNFNNFFEDMGTKPSKRHSLDRFPNLDGNYEPDNCRWATSKEQNRNRRDNHIITLNGESKCLSEWAEISGIGVATIYARIRYGWAVKDAIFEPIQILRRKRQYENV